MSGLVPAIPRSERREGECPMLIARYAKIVMSISLGAFLLLVSFDNVTDYGSNFTFVRHVMSMDTAFPGSVLTYRAVTTPALWHLAYAIIIVSQAVAGILYLWGGVRLFRVRHAPGRVFNQAKSAVIAASLLGFVVFFFMFMVIGGEWFSMWQSKDWNAQQAAFRFYMAVLGVLIFVYLPDSDLGPSAALTEHGRSGKPQD
jgi:predicted small integral membrane protein